MEPAQEHPDFLALDDAALVAQCDVHIYKSSGPGGQHRNKVSSAVRLRHRPTGISAHGDDSRSQHTNKALAIKRLRMNIACGLRRAVDTGRLAREGAAALPQFVRECVFTPRGKGHTLTPALSRQGRGGQSEAPVPGVADANSSHATAGTACLPDRQACLPDRQVPSGPTVAVKRLEVGRRDFRFWHVAAFVLDVLESCGGRMSDAAALVGITTGNLSELITCDRHLLAAANAIRKSRGLGPLR